MYNIKFSNNPGFSLSTVEVVRSMQITPSNINLEIFATEITKQVNLNFRNNLKDSGGDVYYMIVRNADWVVPQNEFQNNERVDIASRNNIIIPVDLHISSIGFGIKSTAILIEIYKGVSEVSGSFSDSRTMLVRSITVPVNINVLADDAILSGDINISHKQGDPLAQSSLLLGNITGDFTIELTGMLKVMSNNIISETYNEETDLRTYVISSSDDVKIQLAKETLGVFSFPILISTTYSTRTIICQLNIEEDYHYVSSVDSIRFTSVTGVSEANPQSFTLTGVGNYQITGPTWLDITPVSGSETTEITVRPWYSDNLGANSFNGEINIFLFNVHYITIPVIYDVSRLALYRSRRIYFTKDNLLSEFYGDNDVDTMVIIDTYADTRRQKELIKAHYNNRSVFDLGYYVENMLVLPNFEELINSNQTVFNYKNISRVNIAVQSQDRVNNEIEFYKEYHNQKYIHGHSPFHNYNNEVGLLDRKGNEQRVYPKSYVIVNFFADNISSNIITTNTGSFSRSEIIENETDIFGVKKQLLAEPGQEIQIALEHQLRAIRLGDNTKVSLPKRYIVFPEPEYPVHHILYITEYNTIGCFATGGLITLKKELEGLNIEHYDNYRERTKRLDVKQESFLEIHTGHALMSDKGVILDIMSSKQVWLDNGKKKIPLVPEDYEETYDNNSPLYNAVLNFKVNTDDIQDYTPAI